MQKATLEKLGLAAVILLAPGGFILGATLAANHYRKRLTRNRASAPSTAMERDAPLDQAASGPS